jgi:RHS repeat-associated protein
MANISYKASMTMTNRYGWNGGNEYEDEGELNYSNTFYRKYDAQIGRFTGIDIKAEATVSLNPYHFGNNNPVLFNDPFGDLSIAEFNTILNTLWSSNHGGTWSSDNFGNSGGGGGFGGGSNIYLFGNESTATFFGGLAANGINYSFGNDGNLRIRDLFVTSISNGTNKRGEAGLSFGGYYENNGRAAEGNRLTEVAVGSLFFKNSIFFGTGNTNGQGDGGGWDAANTTLNAFGFASGIKETIIEGGAALNRGINISKVNDVSLLRTYGASGAKYLKISKGLGIAGSIVTTGYSLSKVYDQYNAPGGLNNVLNHRDVLDAGVGMAGIGAFFFLSNPVGWGIGAGVLIYGGATMIYDAYNDKK